MRDTEMLRKFRNNVNYRKKHQQLHLELVDGTRTTRTTTRVTTLVHHKRQDEFLCKITPRATNTLHQIIDTRPEENIVGSKKNCPKLLNMLLNKDIPNELKLSTTFNCAIHLQLVNSQRE